MATQYDGWACTHSASIIAETELNVTIRVICYWKNQGWRYNMNYVSAWVNCNGQQHLVKDNGWIDTTGNNQAAYEMGYHDFVINKTKSTQNISCYATITSNSSYSPGTRSSSASTVGVSTLRASTVSYNANGGSGAPSSQTKWYGEVLTLSSSRPSRNHYNFQGWATSSGGSVVYQPGGQYGADSNVTLYAIWKAHTHTITYNANGGSGAPGNQTKTYGVQLNLSTTIPTRTNYNFLGWSTTADGVVEYAAGANYTPDYDGGTVTLYAVWELAYVEPRITNFTANRCNSDGTINESGVYIKVTFNWATDKTVKTIQIQHRQHTQANWTNSHNGTISASGTSGNVSAIIGNDGYSTEISYYIRAYVSDNDGTTYSPTLSIGTIKYPIDIKKEGKGVAIGKAAEEENMFDVGWDAKFRGELRKNEGYHKSYRGHATNLDTAIIHGYYAVNTETANVPTSNKYGILEVIESRGRNWQYGDGSSWVWQVFRNTSGDEYHRVGVNSQTMASWERSFRAKVLYDNPSGTTGNVGLSESAANFTIFEIYFKTNDNQVTCGCCKVYKPNGKYATIVASYPNANGTAFIKLKNVLISDINITPLCASESAITGNTIGISGTDCIYITHVIGYR